METAGIIPPFLFWSRWGKAMLLLDHLTVIAPSLAEGCAHVEECLGLKVPFGTRHIYMGTHNHRLQLGGRVYLEIVARDPDGVPPPRARWFGLDDQDGVRDDWDAGRRLRGWVANTSSLASLLTGEGSVFGARVSLPWEAPEFEFAIPNDGRLPLGGALPSVIDHCGQPTAMSDIPDLGARLLDFTLEHPDPDAIAALFQRFQCANPPRILKGPSLRYRARIETPAGICELT